MWMSAACGFLVASVIFLAFFSYRELKVGAELDKALEVLDE